MARFIIGILSVIVLAAVPVLAQQGHVVATPDALKWVEPATFPGARMAVVQGDPSKEGLFVYRVKFPAGYKIPAHTHKASENVTVLGQETLIQVHGVGPTDITFVDPADDPRKKK